MAVVTGGTQPTGTCPFDLLGGVCTDFSISGKEIDRVEILDAARESVVYKKVVVDKTLSATIVGGTAAVGDTVTVGDFTGLIITAGASGSRGAQNVINITAEEFPSGGV